MNKTCIKCITYLLYGVFLLCFALVIADRLWHWFAFDRDIATYILAVGLFSLIPAVEQSKRQIRYQKLKGKEKVFHYLSRVTYVAGIICGFLSVCNFFFGAFPFDATTRAGLLFFGFFFVNVADDLRGIEEKIEETTE